MKTVILAILASLLLTGCLLKTRSELGGTEQSATYSQKNADNQAEAQQAKAGVATENPAALPDERDELIRTLNGRVEVLENTIETLQKDREAEKIQSEQRLTALQEALVKLEKQISGEDTTEKSSTDNSKAAGADDDMQSSDEIAAKIKADKKADSKADVKTDVKAAEKKSDKKLGPYETALELFDSKEWKKAILNFHKYTDESPKGKFVPDAKYKIGVCFQELGMKEEAMAYYEEVVANYQSTDAGKKSKARLSKLKK
jgi:TolA-binding protein